MRILGAGSLYVEAPADALSAIPVTAASEMEMIRQENPRWWRQMSDQAERRPGAPVVRRAEHARNPERFRCVWIFYSGFRVGSAALAERALARIGGFPHSSGLARDLNPTRNPSRPSPGQGWKLWKDEVCMCE